MMRTAFALALVLAATVAVTAIAAAAGAGSPVVISVPTAQSVDPVLVTDPAGDETAAWVVTESDDPFQAVVETAERSAGGSAWTAPVTASDGNATDGDGPQLAVAPSGAAVLAWLATEPQGAKRHLYEVLEATVRPSASALWQPSRQISEPSTDIPEFALGIDADGTATAAWAAGYDNEAIESADGNPATGAWTAPVRVAAAPQGGGQLQVAVNPRGAVLAAWQHTTVLSRAHPGEEPVRFTIYAAERGAGARRWGRPAAVVHFPGVVGPVGSEIWAPATQQLALDPRGDATLVYSPSPDAPALVDTVVRDAGASRWQRPRVLTARAQTVPALAVDGHGTVTAAWLQNGSIVTATRSPRAAGWSSPVTVPATREADFPWLSVNTAGDAVVASLGAHDRDLISVRRGPNSAWSEPVHIGGGGLPQAAIDGAGAATIIWEQLETRPALNSVIEAAPG